MESKTQADIDTGDPLAMGSPSPSAWGGPLGSRLLRIPSESEESNDLGSVETVPKRKRKIYHSYVLPNGEVVTSGKGLGRGRPGIKRGPQKPRDPDAPAVARTRKPRNLDSPGATRTRKRKRSEGGGEKSSVQKASVTSLTDSELPDSDSESEDEYTPLATQTRSGRQTQRPSAFVPESPAHKKPRLMAPPVAGELVIKPKSYKGKDRNALCEHCSRGYGPPKNLIVFCDACNLCWHQRCHSPAIPRKVITDARSEWFCSGCLEIKEQSKRKPDQQAEHKPHDTPERHAKSDGPTRKSFPQENEAAIKAYYNDRDKDILIDLLFRAQVLAPDLAIWPELPRAPPTPAKDNTKTIKPQDDQETAEPSADRAPEIAGETEEYDDLFDEHARLYPRPGSGVQLPPESEDIHMLVEGAGSRTFSHRVGGVLQRVGVVG